MRSKFIRFAVLVFSTWMIFVRDSRAADRFPVCPNVDGTYYQANLFPRFADANNRLVLADLTTGENVITLAEELPYVYDFVWSPDCRYLIGHSAGYEQCAPGLIIWDAVTGEQKLSENWFCDGLGDGYPRIFWKQDNSAALISEWYEGWNSQGSSGQRFIWYPEAGEQIFLNITGIEPNFFRIYWDNA
jgi:hypothetical protein